jgi:hypothetical protein
LIACAVLPASGCGSAGTTLTQRTAPARVTTSTTPPAKPKAETKPALSPSRLAAGTIEIGVVNASGTARRFTLAGPHSHFVSDVAQEGEKVVFTAKVSPGRYSLLSGKLKPAILTVGPRL